MIAAARALPSRFHADAAARSAFDYAADDRISDYYRGFQLSPAANTPASFAEILPLPAI